MIPCGCTRNSPGRACERGRKLFTAVTQTLQSLIEGTAASADDERWAAYAFALFAYIDHLRGWWDGDIKVQRRIGVCMLFVRSHGQWVFLFGAEDESLIHEWLAVRGYWQFVGRGMNDPISGYYRKSDARTGVAEQKIPSPLASEQQSSVVIFRDEAGRLEAPDLLPSSPLDLQTRVAVYIALLIACIPRTPTTMERLQIQRKAVRVLQSRGIQPGPPDEQVLQAMIEEAVRQQEQMRTGSRRNTQALQEEGQRNRPTRPLS
jgi:hypothetical protein